MLQWALRYAHLGYSVIPLRQKTKEPLIKWAEYQKRKATEDEIKKWWTFNPDANIGILTGSIASLAVVDLDGMVGIESGQKMGFVSTAAVKTGNGKQLYYKDPEGLCKNEVKKHYPGVDLRGEGGYIVAPPSLHPSGRRYSWLTPVVGVERLPLFPAHLFAEVAQTQAPLTTAVKEESWIAKALEEMKDGNIDDTLFTISSRLRNDGYSERDALVLLRPHAERVGATPGHLEEKIANVWARYEPKSMGYKSGFESGHLSTRLTIHSPTNPDSIKQFADNQMDISRSSEFRTGFAKFDALTGGLRRAQVTTIAARTGVGKSNWLIGPARTLCESGKKVLFFSTEMSFSEIWARYRVTLSDPEAFARHQFYVCDEFAPNAERVEEALKQIRPDVFIFDHINNVEEEHLKISEFMKALKFLSRKFDIPCIMAAQLNRSADWVENGERVTPRLSMIKGSGTIEEVSGQVLLLSETRVTPEGTEIVGVVDKNRWGHKGQLNFVLRQNPWRITEI